MEKKVANLRKDLSSLRRVAGKDSVEAFAQLYCQADLKFDPSAEHKQVYSLCDSTLIDRGRRVVIAAPRGFGKTTMILTIFALYVLCYSKEKYILIVSNNSDQAEDKLANIIKALNEYPLIKNDFPELFGPNGRLKREKKDAVLTGNGILIKALGHQKKMRGLKHGSDRPTLVIIDDLDSESHATSRELKNKVRTWFVGTLLPIGTEKVTNFIMLGNLFHRYSVLADILQLKDKDWERLSFKAITTFPKRMDLWQQAWAYYIETEQYRGLSPKEGAAAYYDDHKAEMDEDAAFLWPERYQLFDLMILYFRDPASFKTEYLNQPAGSVKKSFDPEGFRYWNKSWSTQEALEIYLKENGGEIWAACDPSNGKSDKGDPSAIVVVGACTGKIYALDVDIRRRNSEDLVQSILQFCRRYKIQGFCIETNGQQDYFFDMVQKAALDAGMHMNFISQKNVGSKESRIETLIPYLTTGRLQISTEHVFLKDQFADFPDGNHDDGIDALEMAVRLANSRVGSEQQELQDLENFRMFMEGSTPVKKILVDDPIRGPYYRYL